MPLGLVGHFNFAKLVTILFNNKVFKLFLITKHGIILNANQIIQA